MMKKILVVGSSNTDLIIKVPEIPRPGETLLGGEFKTFPGGKGSQPGSGCCPCRRGCGFYCLGGG